MENNFNFIRIIAAWLVLYGHSFQFIGGHDPLFMSYLPLGTLGVYIFFTISGFLVAQSWENDPNLYRFFFRRILRIFPALIVCILLTTYLLGPVITTLPMNEYIKSPHTLFYLNNILLYPIFYLPGVFEDNIIPYAVNGSLWSLPIEFLSYIILAITAFIFKSKWNYALMAILFLIVTFFWAGRSQEPLVYYGSDLRQLFLCGSFFWIGSVISAFKLQKYLNITTVTLSLVLMLCLEPFTYYLDILSRILIPVTVIGFGIASLGFINKLTSTGDYSYGVYIYAFPIQQSIAYLYPEINLVTYLFSSTIITLILAIASWHLIEKRMMKLKPNKPNNNYSSSK